MRYRSSRSTDAAEAFPFRSVGGVTVEMDTPCRGFSFSKSCLMMESIVDGGSRSEGGDADCGWRRKSDGAVLAVVGDGGCGGRRLLSAVEMVVVGGGDGGCRRWSWGQQKGITKTSQPRARFVFTQKRARVRTKNSIESECWFSISLLLQILNIGAIAAIQVVVAAGGAKTHLYRPFWNSVIRKKHLRCEDTHITSGWGRRVTGHRYVRSNDHQHHVTDLVLRLIFVTGFKPTSPDLSLKFPQHGWRL
ncbi:hypothetical protein R6Q59_036485 [Mikania micrantha]